MPPSILARTLAAVLTLALPPAVRAQHPPTSATPAAPAAQAPNAMEFVFGEPSAPVARVDDEVITAGELAEVLAASHGKHEGAVKASSKDPLPALDRIIDARLIAIEARDSQLDQLPAVKAKLAAVEEQVLKDGVRRKVLQAAAVDPLRVKRAYDELVTVYTMHAVNFDTEAAARAFVAQAAKASDFAAAARAAAAGKKASDAGPGEMPVARFDPVFGPVLRRTKPGAITPPTRLGKTWIVAKVLEVKRLESPQAMAEAEESNLTAEREQALRRFYLDLKRKHAKVDEALLRKLDFDGPKPGAAALKKDQRVLARLDGGATITVAGLCVELERHFWHGLEEAALKKKIGPRVQDSFDSMLFRRLLLDEADRQKLRETEEFRRGYRRGSEGILFDAYLENAVAPGIQVTEAEQRKYYADHLAEYKTPQLLTLELIAFQSVKEAQAALDRLKAGTDFKWLRANADGVIPAEGQTLQVSPGSPVTLSSLPEGFAKALGGAKEGDYRLYQASDHETYVARLAKEYPAGQQKFEEVQEAIRNRIFGQKVEEALRSLAKTLREHHQVQVLLAGSKH